MASEIQVQTISGPPTGANANKVIIPAGQTLSVADGLPADAMPAGSVLQTVTEMNATPSSHSGSAAGSVMTDTALSVNITPKQTGSLFIVHYSFRYGNSTSSLNNARVKITQDGTDTFRYLSGGTSTGDPNNPMTNVAAISTAAQMQLSMTSGCTITSNSTSPMTFTVQAACEGGTLYINNRNDNGADCMSTGFITVQEIKQ